MTITLASTIVCDSPMPNPDWVSVPQIALHYDYFVGDIELRVEGADFSTHDWGWVPVLDFAIALTSLLNALEPGAEQVFEFTESEAVLRFRRAGEEVEVSASYTDVTATARHPDLLEAATRFLDELGAQLLQRHPELADNEYFSHAVMGSGSSP